MIMERKIISGGLYRHYKNKWYFVIGQAAHTETGEVYVTYFPLYLPEPSLFVRPRDMFLEAIDPAKANGLQTWRFLESDAAQIPLHEKVELLSQAQALLRMMGLSIVAE